MFVRTRVFSCSRVLILVRRFAVKGIHLADPIGENGVDSVVEEALCLLGIVDRIGEDFVSRVVDFTDGLRRREEVAAMQADALQGG